MTTATLTRRRAARPRVTDRWFGGRGALNALLIGVAALAIYPYLVMVFGGFKSAGELTSNPGGVPANPTATNFTDLFSGDSGAVLRRALLNSAIVTVPFTALTVLLCAMAGYAFAKYRFRGRNVIFGLLIASMLVPTGICQVN